MSENGWQEYQKLVLAKLEEHGKGIDALVGVVQSMQVDNAAAHEEIKGETKALKVKAGFWGAISGALPSLAVAITWLLKGK